MDVIIQLHDGYLTIIELNEPGAVQADVKPGDKWRGWKYTRLRRKGNGKHTLITRVQKGLMSSGGVALEIRGHA